jgi:DNA-binding IclR family transcriptional regulator
MGVSDESYSTAVERALAILEAVSQREAGLTNSEISRKLEIPKSSASYILRALEARGYLRRERGTGKYHLGLKVLSLARGVGGEADLKQAALPVLKRLVERTGLTAHLAVLDQAEAVYVEKVESPGFIQMDTRVGKRMELHSTGVGKSLIAHLPAADVEALIKGRSLKRKTPKTIVSHAGLLKELEKVRERGYAIDDEENSLGARCLAAPVFDGFGKVIAAVGVSGTIAQIDRASIRRTVERVREAAREISKQIGHSSTPRRDARSV